MIFHRNHGSASSLPTTTSTAIRVPKVEAWNNALATWAVAKRERALEGSDDALVSECAAWCALMGTPAPDATAFLFKLEELIGESGRTNGYGDSWSADLLDAALADARNLLSKGRA